MKYNCMTIRPRGTGKKKNWEVSCTKMPYERVNETTVPHSLGFYHYKVSLPIQNAFDALKNKMIADHVAEINRLNESLSALEKLKLPSGLVVKQRY